MLIENERHRTLLNRLGQYSWLLWIAVTIVAGWILWDRLHEIDTEAIAHSVLGTSPIALFIALACCAGVNLVASVYEGVAVHHVTGRRRWLHPALVASVANPIGHMVGNAILGASALRYRLHSAAGLNALQIGGVIILTIMPFLLAVGWIVDLALVLFANEIGKAVHVPVPTLMALGILGLAKDVGWLWFVTARNGRPLRIAGRTVRLPDLKHTLLQIVLGVGEILLVSSILYVFLPPIGISLLTFVAIFLIAVIVGQLSHVPAGLGVMEAALLLMMPQVPPEALLGAVLLYRAVFDFLPLLVALLLLLAHETLLRPGMAARLVPVRNDERSE